VSDLDDLLASRDMLLGWVQLNAPELHRALNAEDGMTCPSWPRCHLAHRHAGEFYACGEEACASARAASAEAERVMGASP
jgi:hypothetical protein